MSAASERRTRIRREIAATSKRPMSAPAVIRQGVITGVNTDGTVSLTLGGSSTVIPSVRCLAHVGPFAGMTVWVLEFGGPSAADRLVFGVQDPNSKPWVITTTGFGLAANWSTPVVQWTIDWPFASIGVMATRTTSIVANTAAGNPVNATVYSSVPAVLVPQQTQALSGPYEDTISARGTFGCITAAGAIKLTAMTGTTDLAIGDVVQLGGAYLLG